MNEKKERTNIFIWEIGFLSTATWYHRCNGWISRWLINPNRISENFNAINSRRIVHTYYEHNTTSIIFNILQHNPLKNVHSYLYLLLRSIIDVNSESPVVSLIPIALVEILIDKIVEESRIQRKPDAISIIRSILQQLRNVPKSFLNQLKNLHPCPYLLASNAIVAITKFLVGLGFRSR